MTSLYETTPYKEIIVAFTYEFLKRKNNKFVIKKNKLKMRRLKEEEYTDVDDISGYFIYSINWKLKDYELKQLSKDDKDLKTHINALIFSVFCQLNGINDDDELED